LPSVPGGSARRKKHAGQKHAVGQTGLEGSSDIFAQKRANRRLGNIKLNPNVRFKMAHPASWVMRPSAIGS
jgi:hypothetical protein